MHNIYLVNDCFVNGISCVEGQIQADTICILVDTPNASEIARLVNLELTKSGIQIDSMDSLVWGKCQNHSMFYQVMILFW